MNSVIKLRGPRAFRRPLPVVSFFGHFSVSFFTLVFFCRFFDLVSFFHDLGTILRPKTAPKSTKIALKTRSGFWRRSVTVFLRFLLDFRGLRTSKIVLSPTPEHDFRIIAVFVFGPHSGVIFGDFTSVFFTPKIIKNGAENYPEKTSGFLTSFFIVLRLS